MGNRPHSFASRVSKVIFGLGVAAGFLSPFLGAGLAAWSTGSAALASSFGLGAAVPLAGAGALGGFILGSIAAPFVMIGGAIAAGGAYAATKAVTSLFSWMKSPAPAAAPKPDTQMRIDLSPQQTKLNKLQLASSFDAVKQKRANDNKPAPQFKQAQRFGM